MPVKLVLVILSLFCRDLAAQAIGSGGSCPTPVCPGSRQVVAICFVNDTTKGFSTFWDGTRIDNCPRDTLLLSHPLASMGSSETDSCVGTTFTANLTSVEGTVFTSHLSMIPTTSNNGEQVGCYSPSLNALIHECILEVPPVNVTGTIEQQGLSGMVVNLALVDTSGSACVDEYYAMIGGDRRGSATPRVGPFPMNLCSPSVVSEITIGTSRGGMDGPTATLTVTVNTVDLFSNLAVSHSYNTSGVTLDVSWMVFDEAVMSESEVTCSCMSSSVRSDSPTSRSLYFSYNDTLSPGQVTLTVSYQNGSCIDTNTTVYEVTNFGTATVSSMNKERITFKFNDSLLADGVTVTEIRGRCGVGSLEMFWDYPLSNQTIDLNIDCDNYTFQALSSGKMPVGFPFTIQVDNSVTMVDSGVNAAAIGGGVGGAFGGLLICAIVAVIFFICCWPKVKGKDVEKDVLTRDSPQPSDSLRTDTNRIEHQNAPTTGDEYALVAMDRKGKKNVKTPQEALYQDPNAIEHQTAPSGDTYAVVDKPKRGSSKKREPDVVPPGSEGLNYADIDVAASRRKPKPAPQHQTQDPGRVEYADIGEQARL